ncbi:MAG: hypothetical protein GWO19_09085, partial [Nitrospinaceae bacterium]|nr:hypothetical protein [Nitrospinaceae bacterium]NIU96362.1 hypothetical protein [Nitrospinaceae bacterium]
MSKRALEKIDSRKLTKILNLLDSSSDGEVVAAAKSAVHYLRQRGFTWKDLLEDREPVNHPLRGGAGWVKLQDPVVI